MDAGLRFREVKRLFDLICDEPMDTRRQRLRAECADSDVIAAVEALLAAETRSLRRAVAPVQALLQALPDTELQAGDQVGAWRLVRKLASGGMGGSGA